MSLDVMEFTYPLTKELKKLILIGEYPRYLLCTMSIYHTLEATLLQNVPLDPTKTCHEDGVDYYFSAKYYDILDLLDKEHFRCNTLEEVAKKLYEQDINNLAFLVEKTNLVTEDISAYLVQPLTKKEKNKILYTYQELLNQP